MISVKITFDDLRKVGACSTGVERFAKWVHVQGRKKSFYVKEWTPLHTVWASMDTDFVLLRNIGLIPMPYLGGAYLVGAVHAPSAMSRSYCEDSNDAVRAYRT